MSKVFLVRLHVIQFTRYSHLLSASRLACLSYHIRFRLSRTFFKFFQTFSEVLVVRCCPKQLCYVSTSGSICQALFRLFSNFITGRPLSLSARRQLAYISTPTPFCQGLFQFFSRKIGVPRHPDPGSSTLFISHHRSDRSRHPCGGKPQQRNRRYPHPEMRRNHAPADSSAGWPPPGSWV